jgi:hypothetical protein
VEETSTHLPELDVTKCSRSIFSDTFKQINTIAEYKNTIWYHQQAAAEPSTAIQLSILFYNLQTSCRDRTSAYRASTPLMKAENIRHLLSVDVVANSTYM